MTPSRCCTVPTSRSTPRSRAHVAIAFYEPQHEVARREHLSLIGELRRAVAESQLRAFYQPKIDLRSGRAVGAEALVRWRHPELGLLSPGAFIPAAERSGLILAIGDWVLDEACRQMRAWRDAGHEIANVAINLSSLQFSSPSLVEAVAAAAPA